MLVISDLPKEKIKSKYGPIYEIVNSVKDKSSLEIIKERTIRSYPKLNVVEDLYVKKYFSPETREKLRQAKLGKKRSELVKQKISSKMKGKSNFEGKRHREESKRLTSIAMQGNKNPKGLKWIYNPSTDKETRTREKINFPKGYRKGRDPDSIEGLIPLVSSDS